MVCDRVRCQAWGDGAGGRGVMYGLGDSLDVVCLHRRLRLPSFDPYDGRPPEEVYDVDVQVEQVEVASDVSYGVCGAL